MAGSYRQHRASIEPPSEATLLPDHLFRLASTVTQREYWLVVLSKNFSPSKSVFGQVARAPNRETVAQLFEGEIPEWALAVFERRAMVYAVSDYRWLVPSEVFFFNSE